jgi:hypothetical protein
MKTVFKKTLVAALPLVGLLWGVAPASVHADDWRPERFPDRFGPVHQQAYERLSGLHEEFHEHPFSRQEHDRFHQWLTREQQRAHNNYLYRHSDCHEGNRRWDRLYDRRWDHDNWYAERQHHDHGW